MIFLRKAAVSVGMVTTITFIPSIAQAQLPSRATCASPIQRGLTRSRLIQIANFYNLPVTGNRGINRVFEDLALDTTEGVTRNTTRFPSPERAQQTGGSLSNVIPDGIGSIIVQSVPLRPPSPIRNSAFIEVKAVTRTTLPPRYASYQIGGFIDALPLWAQRAVRAGYPPAIVFLTTSDVRNINGATLALANAKGVAVYHSIACEPTMSIGGAQIPQSTNNPRIQFGPAVLQNPRVFSGRRAILPPISPSAPASIGDYIP